MVKKLFLTSDDDFEKALRTMAKAGDLPLPLTDEIVEKIERNSIPLEISEEEIVKLFSTVKKAHQDRMIEKTRSKFPRKVQVFGSYLQSIRVGSELSTAEVANRLGKDRKFVEDIESGILNPLGVPKRDLANIMELFKISITELIETIKQYLAVAPLKRGEISAIAHSKSKVGSKERGENVSRSKED